MPYVHRSSSRLHVRASRRFIVIVELASGSVTDRPWGLTLASLALRSFSGELVVTDGHMRCAIALLDGVVVAASSTFAADSIARVALTNHLVSSTQVGEITKQLAAAPDRDELDLLAEVAHLSPEQTQRLRIRLIAQRAARTFSIDGGAFVLEDRVTLAAVPGCEVDMRAVVYQGARLYLSESRLADDLRQLGTHFTLDPEAFDEVHRYGLTDSERPIIDALRSGASLADLEARHREIDPRTMQSVVYALASCKAVTAIPRTITPRAPSVPRTQTKPWTGRASTERPIVDDRVDPPTTARATTQQELMSDRIDMSAVARPPATARAATSPGVGIRAPTSREPTPGRVPSRPDVVRAASESGIALPRATTSQNDRERAEEAFERGETAMRAGNFDSAVSELARACELSPSNVDYAAHLAWVRFVVATDKEAVAADTRRSLEKAIHRGDRPVVAGFYLGRVERMLGRDSEALRRFREVLDQEPKHAEAASEVRVLESRIAANAKR